MLFIQYNFIHLLPIQMNSFQNLAEITDTSLKEDRIV